jgi:ABC-type lipoprotein release transport system permease subunit
MRLLPWDYGVRNLTRRPLRTALTALGLTLVVFLLFLVVGFLRGLDGSLKQSGDSQVMMIHGLEAGDNLENSAIDEAEVKREIAALLESHLVHYGKTPALSPELVIATTIGASSSEDQPALGVFRGVEFDRVFLVRRNAYLLEGQFPRKAPSQADYEGEILVGRLAAAKLGLEPEALAVGTKLMIEKKAWKISGQFAAPGTLLEAEIWCPLKDLQTHLNTRQGNISLVALRMDPRGDRPRQTARVETFCRYDCAELKLMGSWETEYYASLQRHYQPMKALAWLLVLLVGCAGACGAINTMYAAVATRIREFATLQAIGFSRRSIAVSLMQESILLAAFATLAATGLALLLIQGAAIRFTMGAFAMQLDRVGLLVGCGAGLALGIIGALPPALRAFRLPIAQALKAV